MDIKEKARMAIIDYQFDSSERGYLTGIVSELLEELERYEKAYFGMSHEIEQRIAALFPDEFPLYPEDWGSSDRCVGDHVPESLVMTVCNEVRRLREEKN